MKVLYISHYSDCYGANLALVNLIIQLRKYGVDASVIIPKHGEIEKIFEQNCITYHVQKFYMCRIHLNSSILKKIYVLMMNFLLYRKNAKILNYCDFDLIHSNSSCTDYGDYISNKYKIPHIWHFREFGEKDYNLKDLYLIRLVSQKYKRATCRIAISKAIQEHYKEKYYEECTLIYDGIKIIQREKCNTLRTKKIKFCVLGLINPKKNQIEVLKACTVLRQEGICDYEVHFLGGSREEYLEELNAYVMNNHLSENIFFEGYVENASEKLINYDVGIIPSLSEGFGLVTVEYMNAGLPVIGNNAGATPELVQDGKNGMLYKTMVTGEDLAKCMKGYIENPEKIELQGKAARQIVEENFTVEINASKIYSIYKDIVNGCN